MKCKKLLALVTLCAVVLPAGFAVGAEPLLDGFKVSGSIAGTKEDSGTISLVTQTTEGTDQSYLANVKRDDVAYASVQFKADEAAEVTFEPADVQKEKFFTVADHKEIAVTAKKEAQTEVHKVKFNYIPQAKNSESQVTAVVDKEFKVDLNDLFTDKDGDTMTFSYVTNNGPKTPLDGPEFTYTPTSLGTDTFVFYAQDHGIAADGNLSAAMMRMRVTVQKDALISQLSFSYPGVSNISLSPEFDPAVDQYVLNVPDDIPYVVPGYAPGEGEKCFIGEQNNVNSVSTAQKSFMITYKEGVLQKEYTFTYNKLPKYVGPSTINVEQGKSVSIPLASLYTDADEDTLSITASTVSDAVIENGNWIFTPAQGNQTKEVTFVADDGKGKTSKTVLINTIVMEKNMLKSLSIGTSDQEDGTYVEKNFTEEFLPNRYSYLFEVNAAMRYGKIKLEQTDENTEISLSLKKGDTSTAKIEQDQPFEIPLRDNAVLSITLTDRSTGTDETKVYKITFNRPPEFLDTFPADITGIATGQELSFEYEVHVIDYEASRAPELTAFDAATGAVLGTSGITEDEKRVWNYTPVADGTVNVKFVITDVAGSTAEKIVPVTAITDTQKPVWGGERISLRAVSSTSIEVRWPRPTDNDVDINGTGNIPNIKSYTVYYRKPKTIKQWTQVVKAGKNIDRKTTLKDLTPGTTYEVYITAEDRSGNISEACTSVQITTSSSGGGGNNGGGGGGGGGVITPVTPTPTPTPGATPSVTEFSDMTPEYEWAQTAVTELAKAGVVNGTGEGQFSPGSEVTRADFLVMLFRALDIQYEATDNFSDVPEGSYYYQTIGMAKAMGVATGGENNMFYPEQQITREDMITLTFRVLGQLGRLPVQPEGQSFGDLDQVSEYAVQPVLSLNANGIIAGDENGNVNPKANTQRCEAAVMIYRIWNK